MGFFCLQTADWICVHLICEHLKQQQRCIGVHNTKCDCWFCGSQESKSSFWGLSSKPSLHQGCTKKGHITQVHPKPRWNLASKDRFNATGFVHTCTAMFLCLWLTRLFFPFKFVPDDKPGVQVNNSGNRRTFRFPIPVHFVENELLVDSENIRNPVFLQQIHHNVLRIKVCD